MSEEKAPLNKSDPHTYYSLRTYLTEPEKFDHVTVVGKRQWKEAFEIVMAMPEGPERAKLLATLSTALTDMRRRVEMYTEVNVLREQLRASRPEIAELDKAANLIKQYAQLFIDTFKKVYAAEEKRGTDMWGTAWPWYEHELYTYVPAINRAAEDIARVYKDKVLPELDDEGGELLNPEKDENNPHCYAHLRSLMDSPAQYAQLPAETVQDIRVCMGHAESLPAGPMRIKLLTTLDRSLKDAVARYTPDELPAEGKSLVVNKAFFALEQSRRQNESEKGS